MIRCSTLPLLLACVAFAGCASSGGVPQFRDGTAPGSPWQLIAAGLPRKGGEVVPTITGPVIKRPFVVVLSNVSHKEQYLDALLVYRIDDQTGRNEIHPSRKKIERMIEEDEGVEVELLLSMTRRPLQGASSRTARSGPTVRFGVIASMRDGTKYKWVVEIPSRYVP